jgi:class 3 adenylate cyclase
MPRGTDANLFQIVMVVTRYLAASIPAFVQFVRSSTVGHCRNAFEAYPSVHTLPVTGMARHALASVCLSLIVAAALGQEPAPLSSRKYLVLCPRACPDFAAAGVEYEPPISIAARKVPGLRVDMSVVSEDDAIAYAKNTTWYSVLVTDEFVRLRELALASGKAVRLYQSPAADTVLRFPAMPPNVLPRNLRTDLLGYAAGALACKLMPHRGTFWFLSDGSSSLDRAARAGLKSAVMQYCNSTSVSINGIYNVAYAGITPVDSQALQRGTVIVTFGPVSDLVGSSLYANSTARGRPLVALLPLRLESRAGYPRRRSAFAIDMETIADDVVGGILDSTYLDMNAFPLSYVLSRTTVGGCVPLCDPTPSASDTVEDSAVYSLALLSLTEAAAGTGFEPRWSSYSSVVPSSTGVSVYTPDILSSRVSNNTIAFGYAYYFFGSNFLYIVSATNAEPAVLDVVSFGLDAGVTVTGTFPVGGATAHLGNSTYIVQGGKLRGSFISGYVPVVAGRHSVAVVATVPQAAGCPAESSGHTALYALRQRDGAKVVLLYGGVSSDISEWRSLHILNLTSSTCTRMMRDVGRPTAGRYHHGAAYWVRELTIGGVTDTQWMIIAGGLSASTKLFSVVFYAINENRWAALENTVDPASGLTGSPVLHPGVLPVGDQLYILGPTTSAYSFGRAEWRHNLAFADSDAIGSLTMASPVAYDDELVVSVAHSRMPDGRGRLILVRVQELSCPAETVPTPGLERCAECPENTVAEGRNCAACADRHVLSTTPYKTKERCWRGYRWQGILWFAFVLCATVFIGPVGYGFLFLQRRVERARRNQAAAIQLTDAVASMMLERVSHFANVDEPTRVERALSYCVRSLRYYRRTIPDAALRVADASAGSAEKDQEVENASWSDTELGNDTRSSVAGTMARHTARFSSPFAVDDNQGRRSDAVVKYMLQKLSCDLKLMPEVAVTVFAVDNMPRWVDQQRAKALATRIARVYDTVLQSVQRRGGVTDSIVGDRIHCSWGSSAPHADGLAAACLSAFEVTHSNALEHLGLTINAGVTMGQARAGFVGCEGEHAPPFRQFTVYGTVMTEAANLAQAARYLRYSVIVPWQFEESLRKMFIVRFVTILKLGPAQKFAGGPQAPLWVGEIVGLQADTDVWDTQKLAEHVNKFNEAILHGARDGAGGTHAARLLEGLPPRYMQTLQHALVSRQLPTEIVPRAW